MCPLWDFYLYFIAQSYSVITELEWTWSLCWFQGGDSRQKTDNPRNRWQQKNLRSQQQKKNIGWKKENNRMLCLLVFVLFFFNRAFSLITESGFIWEEKFQIKSINKLFFVRSPGFKVTASSLPMCSRSDMASGQPTVCYSRTRRQWLIGLGIGRRGGCGSVFWYVLVYLTDYSKEIPKLGKVGRLQIFQNL